MARYFCIAFILVCLARNFSCYQEFEIIEEIFDSEILKITEDNIVCKNEITGESLDWFTLYKLPKQTKIDEESTVDNSASIHSGTAYLYMSDKQQSWSMSSVSINDTVSLPAMTMQKLYSTDFSDSSSSFGYVLYNDQADSVTFERGHTKGVVLFNKNSAVWIVHSVPHYPPKPGPGVQYHINSSQCFYGQSMLCMSLSFDQLGNIGQQLLYNYPQVYDYFIPESLKSEPALSDLISVVNGAYTKMGPWYNLIPMETVGGEQMLSFAKFTEFEDDLYAALLAPKLSSNLLTETWNNGAGTLPSNCSESIKYQVHNIEEINFEAIGVRFSVHHDHSKWAVTSFDQKRRFDTLDLEEGESSDAVKVACVGDINRQVSQYRRAGGTVCFMNNEKVWQQYSMLVDQILPCKRNQMLRETIERKFQGHVKIVDKKTKEGIVML